MRNSGRLSFCTWFLKNQVQSVHYRITLNIVFHFFTQRLAKCLSKLLWRARCTSFWLTSRSLASLELSISLPKLLEIWFFLYSLSFLRCEWCHLSHPKPQTNVDLKAFTELSLYPQAIFLWVIVRFWKTYILEENFSFTFFYFLRSKKNIFLHVQKPFWPILFTPHKQIFNWRLCPQTTDTGRLNP